MWNMKIHRPRGGHHCEIYRIINIGKYRKYNTHIVKEKNWDFLIPIIVPQRYIVPQGILSPKICCPPRYIAPQVILSRQVYCPRKVYCPARYVVPQGILSRKVYCPARYIVPQGILSRKVYCPARYIVPQGKYCPVRSYSAVLR